MRLPRLWLLLTLMLLPEMAAAHGGLAGGGGFYNGAAHPFLAIEQFLCLLGLGLLIGTGSGPRSRGPLLFLAAALCAGLVAGPDYATAGPVLLAVALVLGGLLAAALPVSVWTLSILSVLTGWMVGTQTDAALPTEAAPFAQLLPFAGVCVAVFLIVLNAAALSSMGKTGPLRIGVRVVGSWIAGIALMVLTLQLQGTGVAG